MKKMYRSKSKKTVVSVAAAAAVMVSTFGMCSLAERVAVRHDAEMPVRYDVPAQPMLQTGASAEYEGDLLTEISSEFSVGGKEVDKDETVYVFADANGSVQHILVSEVLKNSDKADTLVDETNLSDIVNVKGNETFTQSGNTITWAANGKDITYQGTSYDTPPVSVKVTYYLNGHEISPAQLAGQSGHVTIRFDYRNNAKVTKQIEGEKTELVVPFVAVTGMMLCDGFQNIETVNGKVVAEGQSSVVIGYAMPGMQENLSLDDEKNQPAFPDYFEMSADVTDFSMDMTVTFVTTGSAFNIAGDMDLTSLDDMVTAMEDAGTQLADGSGQLVDGLELLQSKMSEFCGGVSQLKNGLQTLSDGSSTLAAGVTTLNGSAQALSAGINTLNTSLLTPMTDEAKAQTAAQAQEAAEAAVTAQFDGGMYDQIAAQGAQAFTSAMTSDMTVAQIQAGLQGAGLRDALFASVLVSKYNEAHAANPEVTYEMFVQGVYADEATTAQIYLYVDQMLGQIAGGVANGIAENGAGTMGASVADACKTAAVTAAGQSAGQSAVAGAEGAKTQIYAQINAVQANGYSLVTGVQALAQGTDALAASVPTLTGGVSQLLTGADALSGGAGQLSEGVNQLADGSDALSSGINQFNQEAIQKLADTYNGNVKSLMERLRAVLDASMEYETFTLLRNGDTGATKFIIKTEGIQ